MTTKKAGVLMVIKGEGMDQEMTEGRGRNLDLCLKKSKTYPNFMERQQREGMTPVLAAALAEAPPRPPLII